MQVKIAANLMYMGTTGMIAQSLDKFVYESKVILCTDGQVEPNVVEVKNKELFYTEKSSMEYYVEMEVEVTLRNKREEEMIYDCEASIQLNQELSNLFVVVTSEVLPQEQQEIL